MIGLHRADKRRSGDGLKIARSYLVRQLQRFLSRITDELLLQDFVGIDYMA